jgi:hypothetical protein
MTNGDLVALAAELLPSALSTSTVWATLCPYVPIAQEADIGYKTLLRRRGSLDGFEESFMYSEGQVLEMMGTSSCARLLGVDVKAAKLGHPIADGSGLVLPAFPPKCLMHMVVQASPTIKSLCPAFRHR